MQEFQRLNVSNQYQGLLIVSSERTPPPSSHCTPRGSIFLTTSRTASKFAVVPSFAPSRSTSVNVWRPKIANVPPLRWVKFRIRSRVRNYPDVNGRTDRREYRLPAKLTYRILCVWLCKLTSNTVRRQSYAVQISFSLTLHKATNDGSLMRRSHKTALSFYRIFPNRKETDKRKINWEKAPTV